METFNETFTLLLLYMVLCFSSWMSDYQVSHYVGSIFIYAIIGFASVHVIVLFSESIRQFFPRIRRYLIRFKHRKVRVLDQTIIQK